MNGGRRRAANLLHVDLVDPANPKVRTLVQAARRHRRLRSPPAGATWPEPRPTGPGPVRFAAADEGRRRRPRRLAGEWSKPSIARSGRLHHRPVERPGPGRVRPAAGTISPSACSTRASRTSAPGPAGALRTSPSSATSSSAWPAPGRHGPRRHRPGDRVGRPRERRPGPSPPSPTAPHRKRSRRLHRPRRLGRPRPKTEPKGVERPTLYDHIGPRWRGDVVALPGTRRAATGRRPLLAGGAGAALLAAGAAGHPPSADTEAASTQAGTTKTFLAFAAVTQRPRRERERRQPYSHSMVPGGFEVMS